MWLYEKRLMYPVRIHSADPALARAILQRLGGADGELSAAIRYLSQRCAMPCDAAVATLTDIGTEELAHAEMLMAIVNQLTDGASEEQLKEHGFLCARGQTVAFAAGFCAGGDPMALLNEDMAMEQRARAMYDDIIRMTDDPEVLAPIKFLRQREIVHSQRLGEVLAILYRRACQPDMNGEAGCDGLDAKPE
ncbi:MAG: manganese catalase family protein [Clostridiales bacterium]|nr:manganese catalase family protein [Clostridiales bacterium]